VNDAPVAAGQAQATAEDTPLVLALSASDIDSPSLTFSLASTPSHGTLSALGTPTCTPSGLGRTCTVSVTYTPAPDYTAPATVSLTISAVNDAPVAVPPAAVPTLEDTPVSVTLTATDIDSPTLTFSVASSPSQGTLSALGTPTCTPSGAGTTCTVSVTYTP